MRTVSVTGSRAEFWQGREQVIERLVGIVIARLASRWSNLQVISGESPTGVDIWVKQACKLQLVSYRGYPAEWQRPDGTTNKQAGFERNEVLATKASDAIIIWDGQSPGSKDMLARCLRHKVHTEVLFP